MRATSRTMRGWAPGLAGATAVALSLCVALAGTASADPYPPTCNYLLDASCPDGPANPSVHYAPVLWPADASFFPYTQFGTPIYDPRVQDPSNGGTSPQNYVNVSSECPDRTQPSIKLALDPVNQVVVFRWRTEQIANTYATGPSAGAYGSTAPWNSAQWTVLIDTNGDGFRDFALHLDGSSGSPAQPIDRVAAIWGNTTGTQSVDYVNDPNIYYLAHNPTAFVDAATQRILNFNNTLSASPLWPNGSNETVWDYGTTRSINISTPGCTEYQLDYQIPVSMLNASVCCEAAPGTICESPSTSCTSDAQCTNPAYPRCLGGPAIDGDTPLSVLFTTANSLQDPLQKDIVVNGDFIPGVNGPLPFGDTITLNGGTLVQPIVKEVTAQGCNLTSLTAQVLDIPVCDGTGACTTSIADVDFYAYYDRNGDGVANDGQSWTFIASGITDDDPLGRFTASWNSQTFFRGQYLIAVEAVDQAALNGSGKGNRTFSYLAAAEIAGLCAGTPSHNPALTSPPQAACPPANEDWYGNLAPKPGKVIATFQNTCGMNPPSVTKQVLTTQPVAVGSPTQFRITVSNPASGNAQPLLLSNIHDVLPQDIGATGFKFVATNSDTCGATTSPVVNSTTLDWTFAPAISLAAGTSCSITFTASAPMTANTYSNTASALTDFGTIGSPPASIAVGPASLTIVKSASVSSANPGDTITYTLRYSNDSAISATNVVLQDVLPTGLTFVSATGGGTYDGGTRTITWSVGSLASGDGPFTVSFNATVDSPYPSAAAIPLVNTATIDSDQTAPASSSVAAFINASRPNLVLQKVANKPVVDPSAVAPGNQVTFTVSYQNIGTGSATATAVVITDAVPLSWSFVSAVGCTHSSGTLTCNIGAVPAGGSGSVTYTLQAGNPYSGNDPTINTATIDSNETDPVSASTQVGVREPGDATCPVGAASRKFYFHDETVAIPGQGNPYLANLTAPLVSDTGATYHVTAPGGGAYVPALTFYREPAGTRTINVVGTLTTTLYINRNSGPGITVRGTVQTWRDGVGVISTLGTGTQSYNGSKTGQFVFSIAGVSGTQLPGDRLRWFFEVSSNTGTQADLLFQWDGTACNSETNPPCGTTTFADSSSIVCFTEPASLSANKRVDKLSAQAGNSLAYTFDFGNGGGTTVTGATLADTFPAGVNVSGCTYSLNGGAAAACPCVGQTCTFPINSPGQPAGQVPGGASGTLVVNVAVASPLAAGIYSLTNTASTDSNETDPAPTNSVTTTIVRPNVTIAKSVSDSLLIPNDTVTYTLTALNSGNAAAAGVQIVDVLPVSAYYTYVAGSVSPGGPACTYAAPTMTCNLGALAVGATATVTFQMRVAAAGAPNGVTVIGNTATVSDSATSGTRTSNNVDVSISTNPNLHLAKSVADVNGGSVEAGDTLRYTLTATNDGSASATGVVIADPIPSRTTFVSVSCSSGTGSFDTYTNQAVCSVPALAGPAGVVTMTVDVLVDTPLPNGTTVLNNTATLSASNAASKTASASINATAAPLLSVAKSGPASVGYPLTTLAAGATASTTISVTDATYIGLNDHVVVGGTVAQVTGVSGTTITLDTAVTAAAGAGVIPTWEYVLVYANSGGATATGVVVSDTMPAGVACVSTSPAADAPGCAATVNWTVGSVVPGDSGTLRIRVRPTSAGTFVNTATIDSTETAAAPSNAVTTRAGAILLSKSTTTPLVQNTAGGVQAVYTIALANQTAGASANVTVTDPLPAGFTFVAGSSVFGGGTCTGLPAGGSQTAIWTGCTVPASGTLTITFTANIASTVGASTYDNPVSASGGSVGIVPFEELGTTDEDVTVVFNTVSGTVFFDRDGDGVQDAGEAGIANVTVTITGPSCPAGCTVLTDASGSYEFADLAPGSYSVRETDPAGYASTTSNLVPIAVSAGDTIVNFGDQPQYTISGIVYEDANGNGVQDAGETGLAGVTVELFDSAGVLVATTLTDASGLYVFDAGDGVVAGAYTVRETDPMGYASTTGNVVPVSVATGGAATANFGDAQPDSIAGTVYYDINGNGVQDPDEVGIAGVTITLLGTTAGSSCNPVACTVLTDANGNYEFTGLAPGAYNVHETDLAGFSSTTSNDLLLNLAAGETAHGSFGDRFAGNISGIVYADVDSDGSRDASEPALTGVLVELYTAGADGLLGTADDVLVASTTSGQYGYEFESVAPGTYLVVETDPAGWTSTTLNAVPVTIEMGGSGGIDFGDIVEVTISGTVYNDLDGDGAQDPGEPGIGGVTVTLTGTTPGASCPADCTAITSGDGTYIFINLAPGTYDVVESDPSGFTSTTVNTIADLVVAGGSASAHFGDQLAGSVSGTVFLDGNSSGVQDPDEPGLGGVTIELLDPATGAVVATATTTADGRYMFTGVAQGNYVVRETDPAGFASTTSNLVPISVSGGGAATADFGDTFPNPIAGTVFEDRNGNGIQDAGEAGIGGVTVTLTGTSAGTSCAGGCTTTTGADGSYIFSSLLPGSYVVEESDPSGYTSTTPNAVPVSLANGETANADFGDQLEGTISGTVFNDTNASGEQDASEQGIGGVTVQLVDPLTGAVIATTTTAADGSYQFAAVAAGSYIVRETDPAGFASTTANSVPVTLTSDGAATANFGDTMAGSIAGTVFNDVDANGVQGAGEAGLGGVTIGLYDATTHVLVATTTTSTDGTYVFTGVAGGTYDVQETDPAGFTSTTSNAVTVNLADGGVANADFGDRLIGSVSGTVYADLNGNGVQDPDEQGLAGVVVTLAGPSCPMGCTATSDINGNYVFTGITAGAYTITETDPAGYTSSTPNAVAVTLDAGGSATANFGDQPIGSIAGVVFNDLDGDGNQDPGELGLGNVSVNVSGPSCPLPLGCALTTAGDGSYYIGSLAAGAYTVVETNPPGFQSTTPDSVGVTLGAGGAASANFGDRVQQTLSGFVFNDLDADGTQDAGEPGIAGVTVTVTGTSGGASCLAGCTAVTTVDGSYVFVGLAAGNYTVVETNPTGYVSTTADTFNVVIAAGQGASANFGDEFVGMQADLSISKDDGVAIYTAGGSLSYTITVSNAGPNDATGATVTDTLPPQLHNAAWTCSGTGAATCTASGSGSISETVNVPVGDSVTFLVSADVIAGATIDPLSNTATVAPPLAAVDPVAGNNSATDSDSPAAAASSIGDRIWLDENGNGVQDAGEDGIANVTVGLYDVTGTILLATTITDTEGRFVFTAVAAGDYVVRVDTTTMPAGLAANPTYDFDDATVAPDGETAITVAAGALLDSADFGFNWVPAGDSTAPGPGATGAIGDRIWNDANGDGVQGHDEAGIAGVTVLLLTDDNGDGVYGGAGDNAAVTTTTSASGNFAFDGIAPGSYVLQVDTSTLPAGFATSPTGDPDGDGDSTTNPIEVAPGDVFVNADFGYMLPSGSRIGNVVYLDSDGDGTQDAGDPGIAGVTVVLLDAGGNVVASTATDSNGNYSFRGLPDGIYTVVVSDTAGILLDTPLNSGDPDGGNDRMMTVVLAGADNLTVDLGFAPDGHDAGDGMIGNSVFLDRDGNGSAGAGEGIEGVTVWLYDAAGTTLIATAVTDASGNYVFGGLDPADTYVVTIDTTTLPGGGAGLTNSADPDGGIANSAIVDLSAHAGGTTLGTDFGYSAAAPNTIGGSLWNDSDGDGTLDAGETGAWEGVTIVLRDGDGNIVATTTTDASGNYEFSGLPDGNYSVYVVDTENVLAGAWHSSGPAPGADGNSQFDGYVVTVAGGIGDTTADFGYFAAGAAIGNLVWSDIDNDGIQDAGEPGLAGVTVTMTVTYPSGDVTTMVAVTDATGAYAFGNLLLDESFDGTGGGEPTYSVSVATPPGMQPSPIGQGGDPRLDSNDPAGSTTAPVKGVTDATDDALASNGVDFGFVPRTDVSVVKTGPASVVPGTDAVYTITVTNNGPSDALTVSVADPTPSNLTFVSNAGDCASAYPCALGTIAPGASRTITTTYSVPSGYTTPNPVLNTATVTSGTPDPTPGNDSSTSSTPVVPSADVSVLKVGPGGVQPGTSLVYTIVVTNNGPSDATGVSVADPTPSGLTFVSNSGACVTGFPCTLGTIAAGATRTITSTFSVPLTYTTPVPIVNTATVSATTPDPVAANNTSTESTVLSPLNADLSVVKTAPASVTPGSTVSFTLVVTNNGPDAALSTVVTDPVPSGLTFVSNAGDCVSAFPCTLGTLLSGATRTITATYSVPASYTAPDPVQNIAIVSSDSADPVAANNTSTASAPVTAQADVRIQKNGPASFMAGHNVTYTVTVTNDGPSDATVVSVADPTPAGLTFVSNSGNCATAYPCALGTIAAGATQTITSTYAVPAAYAAPDPVVNTATVSSGTSDTNMANNTSSASTPAVGNISGVVFHDVDLDGLQGVGEVGLAGVTVRIVGPSCLAPAGCVVTSGVDGSYSFASLSFGAYTVTETDPGGYTSTTANDVAVSVGVPAVIANFGDVSSGGVDSGADLALTKSHSGTFQTGGTGLYTLIVRNLGPDASSGPITVSDALPAGLTYLSASGSGWTCASSFQVVTCQMTASIASGATSAPITMMVSVGDAAYPTVVNTASVYSSGDPNPVNNAASDGATVKQGSDGETCPVALKKVHSGNDNPGGQVQYTLQWSNACRTNLTNVTIVDPLPQGLQLVSATSADATVTIAGNTVTFRIASFTAGTVGKGFVTARIDSSVAPGTSIENVATLSDAAGNAARASNFFRVRGGSTDSSRLSCFVRAQNYARPGRFVKYDVRYKNGTNDNSLSLTLPEQVEIVSIYPQPDSTSGRTLFWSSLAQTSGRVTVNTTVTLTAQDQSVLTGSAFIDDGAGQTAVCEHVGVVSRYEKLFASIKAQTHSRPGLTIRYTARYREVVGSNEMTISLPDEVAVVKVLPAPSGGSDKTLTWNDLPTPSGVVKVDAVVGASVADGTVLSASLTMTDETTDVVTAETRTVIGSATSTDGGGGLGLALKGVRSVTAGTTSDFTASYSGVQQPGTVTIELPAELTATMATPAALFAGNQVIWTGVDGSGSLKLRTLVSESAASGKTLVVRGSLTDATAATATAQATTVVRDNTTTAEPLSLALTVPGRVVRGLTTDIDVAYDGLQGTGKITLLLPTGMTLQSTVPAGATVVGREVTWSGLAGPSGSVRARVLVSSSLASGTTLPVSAKVVDGTGGSASAAGTTTVR